MHVSEVVRARRPLARRASGSDTQSARRGDRFHGGRRGCVRSSAPCHTRGRLVSRRARFSIMRGKPSSLGLLPTKSPPLVPRCFSRRLFPRWRRGAFLRLSVFFLNARCQAVRRIGQPVDTVPPYNESYFLLETYLPFLLFSAMMLFLKSTKHPYFVKKSLDLIFQRD